MTGRELVEGERVGKYVVLRDRDGHRHAVSATAVSALCEIEDGTLLLLPGGRLIQLDRPLSVVLAWLDGRPTG